MPRRFNTAGPSVADAPPAAKAAGPPAPAAADSVPNAAEAEWLRECRPFTSLLQGGCGRLLRGEAPGRPALFRADVRRDRRPRNLPPELHDAADAWFGRQFGVRYRGAALFCSGSAARGALRPGVRPPRGRGRLRLPGGRRLPQADPADVH